MTFLRRFLRRGALAGAAYLLERHRLRRRAGAEGKGDHVAVVHDEVRRPDVGGDELAVFQDEEAEGEAISRRVRTLAEAAFGGELAAGLVDAADCLAEVERLRGERQSGKLEQVESRNDRPLERDALGDRPMIENDDQRCLTRKRRRRGRKDGKTQDENG